MLSKALALSVLNEALSTGGDYAEIYAEENHSTSLVSENGKIESVSCPVTYGAGIRILKGLRCTYGYTCDLTKKGLLSLANKLSKSCEGERVVEVKSIKRQSVKKINPISEPLDEVKIDDKIAYLKKGYDAASSYDERIVRVRIGWSDYKKRIEIYSAEGEEGKFFANSEERGRLSLLCVAREGEKIESAYDGPGAFAGWEYFAKNIDIQKQARETASKAIALLTAKECPSGRYTVVIGNGWGGVVFHEACGHSLEATATAKGLSVFSNSIGK